MDFLGPSCRERLLKPFHVEELTRRVVRLAQSAHNGAAQYPRVSEGPAPEDAYGPSASRVAADVENLAGAAIGGCELDRVLGRGATAVVYLARHVVLDVPVAVKLMPSATRWDAEELRRAIRGAKAAARIQHPNVAEVLNAGEEKGFYFVVERYCEGDTLRTLIETQGRLREPAVSRLLQDMASGLGAVHGLDIVHRDVKPANIIIKPSGMAVLTDFGLARGIRGGDISSGSSLIGTPYYMSPEQCEGRPLDGRSDLYSLGATAYHALTGRRAIVGETAIAVLRAHGGQVPRPPVEVIARISRPISDVIMKLLEKKPDARYQAAGELLTAVEGLMNAPGRSAEGRGG